MTEKKYYFIAYEIVPRAHASTIPTRRANAIIEDVHPLIWVARPTSPYDDHFTTTVLWWAEISEEVACDDRATGYFSRG